MSLVSEDPWGEAGPFVEPGLLRIRDEEPLDLISPFRDMVKGKVGSKKKGKRAKMRAGYLRSRLSERAKTGDPVRVRGREKRERERERERDEEKRRMEEIGTRQINERK